MEHSPDRNQGVFTSVAVRNGRPVLIDRHLIRLGKSCEEVYGRSLPSGLVGDVREAASNADNTDRIRIEISPTDVDLDVQIDVGPRPGGSEPMELQPVVVDNWEGSQKWIDRSMLPTGRSLFVDGDEQVLEIDIANVFAVIKGEIVTPPLDGRILPGIGRSVVMDIRRVREERLLLHELLTADEAFATNALRGVVSIARCDSRVWAAPGPITTQLSAEWARAVLQ